MNVFKFFFDCFYHFFLITVDFSYHFFVNLHMGFIRMWGSIRTGCSGIGLYLAAAPIHVPSSSRFYIGSLGGCTGVLLSLL